MAEFGAHLTSTKSLDEGRPSIFDVIADEDLVTSLKPALKHGLQILAQKNPSRFGWLHVFGDEVYTALHLLLEHYHLKHYGASFAEYFYGMKRTLIGQSEGQSKSNENEKSPLPGITHFKSLLSLVMVPYLKGKFDQLYDQLSDERMTRQRKGMKGKLCRAFLACYPYLHSAWEALILVCHLGYILNKLRFHHPLLRLAGVLLNYLTPDDMEAHSSGWLGNVQFRNKRLWEKILILCNQGLWAIARMISSSLSVGMFFLRFLELWYSTDRKSSSLTAMPNPPPPPVEEHSNLPKLNTICPLCQKMRTNDTALSVTGYVFCYPCIYMYIRDHGQCPVTGYPARTDHLVKIYMPDG